MNLDIATLKQQLMLPQLLNSGLESVLNYLNRSNRLLRTIFTQTGRQKFTS